MFSSYPQHEFHAPDGMADPAARHWRYLELLSHTPWFLLTVEMRPDGLGDSLSHTWCIAWEKDLAQTLIAIDTAKVRGLVCMLPAWATPQGQWTAREIREVWLVRTEAAGEHVSLKDADGEELSAGIRSMGASRVLDRRLLLQVQARSAKSLCGPRRSKPGTEHASATAQMDGR